jgi:CheY-like chemotaxis protein
MTTQAENTAQPKILVVDDNEAVRTSLKAVLEASQFRVTTATNVSDALHLIAHDFFDVLLSDLHMPGPGDGLTVVSAMRPGRLWRRFGDRCFDSVLADYA